MSSKPVKKCQKCRASQSAKTEVKIYFIVEGNNSGGRWLCTPCFMEFNKKQYEAHKGVEPDYDTKS